MCSGSTSTLIGAAGKFPLRLCQRTSDRMSDIFNQLEGFILTMVAWLFIWAGFVKLISPESFRTTLWRIPHLPPAFVPFIQWALPICEIGVAIGLVLGMDLAKVIGIWMLLMFSGMAIAVMHAKLELPCNCFGGSERYFSKWTVLQNCTLAGLIASGIPCKHPDGIFINLFASAIFILFALCALRLRDNRILILKLKQLNVLRIQ